MLALILWYVIEFAFMKEKSSYMRENACKYFMCEQLYDLFFMYTTFYFTGAYVQLKAHSM